MPPHPDAWGERLPRSLGLWSAIAVLIGSTIGSGIFRVPAGVAARLGEPGPVLLAWVLGGLIALFGALTISELAAAMPRSGGVFAYLLEGFGPLPAFLFGWSELTVIRASALGAIATIFAEYLGYFIKLSPEQVRYVAAAAVLLVGAINYFGAAKAAVVMNLVTLAKYGALAGLAILAFVAGDGSVSHFTPAWKGGIDLSLIGTALIAIMWTYDGWADLSFMGGEVKDPGRTFPLALIFGTAGIVLVYLLINVAYIYLVPLPEMASRQAGGGHRSRPDSPARRRRRRGGLGDRDDVVLRRPQRLDDDRPADLLRHGRPGALLPRHRPGLTEVREPVGRDLARDRARDGVRAAERLPAAGRQVHPGNLAVLRAGGGGGVRAPAHPARHAEAVSDVGLPGGAAAVPGGVARDGGERAGDGPA